jgi:hypothetical protein
MIVLYLEISACYESVIFLGGHNWQVNLSPAAYVVIHWANYARTIV